MFLRALSTKASGQGSLYFSNISLSSDPAFTPILIEQSLSFAARIISLIFFLSPIFPGFILKHFAPLFADSKARAVLTKEEAKMLNSKNILKFEKPYLDILYSETQDLLHDRLGRAVIRLASIWQYCWEQAGKPALP